MIRKSVKNKQTFKLAFSPFTSSRAWSSACFTSTAASVLLNACFCAACSCDWISDAAWCRASTSSCSRRDWVNCSWSCESFAWRGIERKNISKMIEVHLQARLVFKFHEHITAENSSASIAKCQQLYKKIQRTSISLTNRCRSASANRASLCARCCASSAASTESEARLRSCSNSLSRARWFESSATRSCSNWATCCWRNLRSWKFSKNSKTKVGILWRKLRVIFAATIYFKNSPQPQRVRAREYFAAWRAVLRLRWRESRAELAEPDSSEKIEISLKNVRKLKQTI